MSRASRATAAPKLTAPQRKLLSAISEGELLRTAESSWRWWCGITSSTKSQAEVRDLRFGWKARPWLTVAALVRKGLLIEVESCSASIEGADFEYRWYEKAESVKELRCARS